jgi:hypothetical protein
MTVIQIILIVWLLSIFVSSIYEIFHKDPPSGLFLGLCFIIFGILWVVNLKIKIDLKPWIGSFYVSGLIGILFIISGTQILLKPPWRSWIVGTLIIILTFFLFAYGPTRKKSLSVLDFLDQITTKKLWNNGWFKDIKLD